MRRRNAELMLLFMAASGIILIFVVDFMLMHGYGGLVNR